jgi:7-keto-8-aminopelargonate synthetase-like enzyme
VLSSDNYLGIAGHPLVRQAAAEAAMRWGAGAGSSRTASGNMSAHRRLEQHLAEFTGFESAMVQGPAHMSVAATIAALAGPGDVVFSDQLNQPGIVAGCRLSGAEVFVYGHGDLDHLAFGLEEAGDRAALIVSESLFAAEGDQAPLEGLYDLAGEFGCRLLIEESHAIGAVGPEGRGLVAQLGMAGDVDLILASLSKALGSYGSFVACDRDLAEYLSNASDSMLCSSALPPAMSAAADAALGLLREHPYRVERLRRNAECLRSALEASGLRLGPGSGHIITIPTHEEGAVAACESVLAQGIMVGTARPPQLPPGEAALRLTVMATHREGELRRAARVIADRAKMAGVAAATRLQAVPARGAEFGEPELPAWVRAA